MRIREVGTVLDFNAKRPRGVLRFRRDELLEWPKKNSDDIGEAVLHIAAQQNVLMISRHDLAGDEEDFSGNLPTLF
jgi:hypothetical protein